MFVKSVLSHLLATISTWGVPCHSGSVPPSPPGPSMWIMSILAVCLHLHLFYVNHVHSGSVPPSPPGSSSRALAFICSDILSFQMSKPLQPFPSHYRRNRFNIYFKSFQDNLIPVRLQSTLLLLQYCAFRMYEAGSKVRQRSAPSVTCMSSYWLCCWLLQIVYITKCHICNVLWWMSLIASQLIYPN